MQFKGLTLLVLVLILFSCQSSQQNNSPVKKIETEEEKKPEKVNEVIAVKDAAAFLKKQGEKYTSNTVIISTELGDIKIKLFEDTPLHRANFVMHASEGRYDDTFFYRVVKGFMIQGGNSDNDVTQEKRQLLAPYYIPSEIQPHRFHKRGMVAMAMSYTDNPERKSSQYSFYIVLGKRLTDPEMEAIEREYKITIPEDRKSIYRKVGGTPHLDGIHTVFGEVIEGMDVVKKIADVEVDSGNWPVKDVTINMTVIEER